MRHTESAIQQSFFRLIAHDANLRGYVWATPNGGHRNKITAATMKAEGQMPGVWDVFVAIPSQGFHGMFIEFKVQPQRSAEKRLTGPQQEFRARLREWYRFEVHTDAIEAYQAVKSYVYGAM